MKNKGKDFGAAFYREKVFARTCEYILNFGLSEKDALTRASEDFGVSPKKYITGFNSALDVFRIVVLENPSGSNSGGIRSAMLKVTGISSEDFDKMREVERQSIAKDNENRKKKYEIKKGE